MSEHDEVSIAAVEHRGPPADSDRLTQEQKDIIELLRTKNLSIKYLDDKTKQRIRETIEDLHIRRGISLMDIAKLIGNKTSGYTSWLTRQLGIQPRDFEQARLAGIHKKVRKYERRPFDGTDEDKAYLLGLRHGDLSVSRPFGDAIRVSTSTTHPAMAKLFTDLFSPYGHVYQHPRYKKDTKTYEWNLSTILDNSFAFLMMDPKSSREWVSDRESKYLAYVAGILDSEGSIGIHPAKNKTAITVIFYNTDLELLTFIHRLLTMSGYSPLEPYLDKPRGFRSPGYHIEMKKDYWRVVMARFNESQSLLRKLPLRHSEKVAKRQLALALELGDSWSDVTGRVQSIRNSIRLARDQFVLLARKEFLKNHPEPS